MRALRSRRISRQSYFIQTDGLSGKYKQVGSSFIGRLCIGRENGVAGFGLLIFHMWQFIRHQSPGIIAGRSAECALFTGNMLSGSGDATETQDGPGAAGEFQFQS